MEERDGVRKRFPPQISILFFSPSISRLFDLSWGIIIIIILVCKKRRGWKFCHHFHLRIWHWIVTPLSFILLLRLILSRGSQERSTLGNRIRIEAEIPEQEDGFREEDERKDGGMMYYHKRRRKMYGMMEEDRKILWWRSKKSVSSLDMKNTHGIVVVGETDKKLTLVLHLIQLPSRVSSHDYMLPLWLHHDHRLFCLSFRRRACVRTSPSPEDLTDSMVFTNSKRALGWKCRSWLSLV